MTELTLPFWLTSALLPEAETINDWLKTQHIQPRWIDEVIEIVESDSQTRYSLSGIEPVVPLLHILPGQNSEHHILQAACREIATGDRRLILLLSHRAAVLLAAPAAVGMFNMIPQAYVNELFGLQIPTDDTDLFDFLGTALQKKQRTPSQLKELLLVQATGKRPIKAGTDFEGAAWVKPQQPAAGALSACHELVQVLSEKNQTNGLAVEITANRQLFATWIERV